MRRWNSDLADTVGPVSLDTLHQAGAAFGPAVERGALFGGLQVPVGATAGAVARASGGLRVFARVGGSAGAVARTTGGLAGSAPAAAEEESIAEDPSAAGLPSVLLRSRPVVFDRTPIGRAVSRPEGVTMMTRKQFDTAGELVVELARVVDGVATAAPELADATLVQMRRRSPSGGVSRVSVVVDDVGRGLVRASLVAAMAEVGPHALTFEITTAAGLTTYPYSGALTLVVEPP